jgi:hypothetical protein
MLRAFSCVLREVPTAFATLAETLPIGSCGEGNLPRPPAAALFASAIGLSTDSSRRPSSTISDGLNGSRHVFSSCSIPSASTHTAGARCTFKVMHTTYGILSTDGKTSGSFPSAEDAASWANAHHPGEPYTLITMPNDGGAGTLEDRLPRQDAT